MPFTGKVLLLAILAILAVSSSRSMRIRRIIRIRPTDSTAPSTTPPPYILPSDRVTVIQEVHIKDGTARATSVKANSPWTADKAFSLGGNRAWHNGAARLPSTVWYEFPVGKIFVPARVSFRARQDCCLDEGPTVWQFVGSNSAYCGEFGEWTVLCEDKSDLGYRNKALTKYCDVDEKIMNEYAQFRCLGISVLNTRSKSSAASLRDVRMWKSIVE